MSGPFDEGFIARYLLGDLPEEEQVEVEDRAFSDAQYMQIVLAVEADLIDEYIRGALHASERRQFETRFLASSERREKVEFARALAKVAQESVVTSTVRRPAVVVSPIPWWGSFVAAFRSAGPAAKLALAGASLVLVIGIVLLIVQTIAFRGQLMQLQSERQTRQNERQALEKQIADERALSEDLTGRLQSEQRQREVSEELLRELERERERLANKPAASTILSFALLPGVSRSAGASPKLVVPQSARLLRLQVGIDPAEQYKTFRTEIRAQAGLQIWTQDKLSARKLNGGQAVVLSLPARLLGAGRYELALKGVTDAGNTEDVGYYYFDVLKK